MKIKYLVAVALLVQLAANPIHAQSSTAQTESVIESAGSSTRIVQESAPFQEGSGTNQGSGTVQELPPSVQELPPFQGPALPLPPSTQEPFGSATVQELPSLAPVAPLPVEPTLEFQGSGTNQQIIDLPIEAAPQLSPADDQLFDSLAPGQPVPPTTPGIVVPDQDQLDPQIRLKPDVVTPRPNLGIYGRPIRGWGFAVQSVVPNSVAARMRLEPGDVILAVNGQPAGSAEVITEQLLISTQQNNGCGTVLIDNVRARNQRPVRTCNGYSRTNNRLRYQKLRFQL